MREVPPHPALSPTGGEGYRNKESSRRDFPQPLSSSRERDTETRTLHDGIFLIPSPPVGRGIQKQGVFTTGVFSSLSPVGKRDAETRSLHDGRFLIPLSSREEGYRNKESSRRAFSHPSPLEG